MKKVLLLLIALTGSIAQAQIKYCVYWTAPTLSNDMAEKLARDHLLIIDYENLTNNREAVAKIKQLNPAVKLLMYANPMEVWKNRMGNRPLANSLLAAMPPMYRLKRADGKPVIFWEGMEMMNISEKCPEVNGKNYVDYYTDWLLKNVLTDKLIDGFFMDNGTPTISWVDKLIDADNDRKPDHPTALDSWWRMGMVDFIKTIRTAKGSNFIIATNKGVSTFFSVTDGVMFEKFPNDYVGGKLDGGWHQCMKNASIAGAYTIFQVDYINLEFGIASSLLLDNVYVAVGQNIQIPDKYRFNTGKPLGPACKKNGIFVREYEFARIEVIPSKKIGRIIKK